MTPAFADTFFFLALLDDKDSAHPRAVAFAGEADRKFITTAWVLTEVADGCAARGNGAAFIEQLDELRASSEIEIVPSTSEWFDAGVTLYQDRSDKRWTLTDCISFEVMRRLEITDALTGDHHFAQAGFQTLFKSRTE